MPIDYKPIIFLHYKTMRINLLMKLFKYHFISYIYYLLILLLYFLKIDFGYYEIIYGGWWYSDEDASLLFRGLWFDPRCHRLIFVVVYPCT